MGLGIGLSPSFGGYKPLTTVVVDLQPSDGDDTWLNSSAATTNYGSNTTMESRQADKHVIIKFDLSSIPGAATITAASLTLTSNFLSPAVEVVSTVHAILAANSGWTEAGATWNTIEGSTAWAGAAGCTTSGTDYNGTSMGTLTYPQGSDMNTAITATLNVAQMQAMLAANYGFRIVRSAGGNPTAIWYTAEHTTAAQRPKLSITYQI